MMFTGEAPVLSLHQPWATLCFTPTDGPCSCFSGTTNGDDVEGPAGDPDCPKHSPWRPMVKPIETRSWATKHRGRIWIASTTKVPRAEFSGLRASVPRTRTGKVGDWIAFSPGTDALWRLVEKPWRESCRRVDAPLGCILGSAVITDCLPMTTHYSSGDPECIVVHGDGTADHVIPSDDPQPPTPTPAAAHVVEIGRPEIEPGAGLIRDITNQVPYGAFTPGRYGWLLADPEPLAEPVPFKGGQRLSRRWAP